MNNEVVVAYFEVLSQRLPGDNEDNKVIWASTVGVPAEISTYDLQHTEQSTYRKLT
jgi:hypothetical protein